MKNSPYILALIIFVGCVQSTVPLRSRASKDAIRIMNNEFIVTFPVNYVRMLMEEELKEQKIDSSSYEILEKLLSGIGLAKTISLEEVHSQNSPINLILKEYDLLMIKRGYCSIYDSDKEMFLKKVKLLNKGNEMSLMSNESVVYWNFYSF